MTYATLKLEAAKLALDPGYDRFDEDYYGRWVNDGILYIALRLPLPLVPSLFARDTSNLTANTEEFDLPTDYMRIERVTRNDKNCVLVDKRRWDASQRNTYYEADVNVPMALILGDKVLITPEASSTITDGLKIEYLKRPATLTASTDTPDIDAQFHPLVTRYAGYIAKLIDGDENAGLLLQEVNTELSDMIKLFGG